MWWNVADEIPDQLKVTDDAVQSFSQHDPLKRDRRDSFQLYVNYYFIDAQQNLRNFIQKPYLDNAS